MNRSSYVKICEICLKRRFSFQQGIICSLTEKQADFEQECSNYLLDEKARKVVYETKRKRAEQNSYSDFIIDTPGFKFSGFLPVLLSGIEQYYLDLKKKRKALRKIEEEINKRKKEASK